MSRISIAEAIRRAWASRRVESIAAVCDGLRLNYGFNYAQTLSSFREATGVDIPLPEFDAILRAADDGYSGILPDLNIRRTVDDPTGQNRETL